MALRGREIARELDDRVTDMAAAKLGPAMEAVSQVVAECARQLSEDLKDFSLDELRAAGDAIEHGRNAHRELDRLWSAWSAMKQDAVMTQVVNNPDADWTLDELIGDGKAA